MALIWELLHWLPIHMQIPHQMTTSMFVLREVLEGMREEKTERKKKHWKGGLSSPLLTSRSLHCLGKGHGIKEPLPCCSLLLCILHRCIEKRDAPLGEIFVLDDSESATVACKRERSIGKESWAFQDYCVVFCCFINYWGSSS